MPRDEKLVGCGWMGEWHDELQSADIIFYGPPQAMGLSATLSTVYIYVCGRWVEVDQTGFVLLQNEWKCQTWLRVKRDGS